MAVEIFILSGSRQGERVFLDRPTFRAGDRTDDDLHFDAARDAGAEGRAAVFTLTESGWTVRSAGAKQVLLNHQPVSRSAHVRSGDVIRMSERGPDFSFTITAHIPPAGAAPPPPPKPLAGSIRPTVPDAALSQRDPTEYMAPQRVSGSTTAWPLYLAVAVGLVVAMFALFALGFVVWFVASQGQRPVVHVIPAPQSDLQRPGTPQPIAPQSDPPAPGVPTEPSTPPPTQPREPLPPVEPKPQAPPVDPWSVMAEQMKRSLYLIEVEDEVSETRFPFASCCAIDQNTLLTSASAATELAKFRQKGFRLWTVQPEVKPAAEADEAKVEHEVGEVRVHVGYAHPDATPLERGYVDFGLLRVDGPLTDVAQVASAADLAELEQGVPLAWIGFVHKGKVVTRYHALTPQMFQATLFAMTALEPGNAASARLLHLEGTLPEKIVGGPIVNVQGRVMAVYSAAADRSKTELELHYAPVVEPQVIDRWLKHRDERFWVPPVIAETGSAQSP
jgi:hypothetical protein